ncbi:MAG TPA: FtsX-like permease family protein [Solirubrobacterales bacterium]|nr:FtsX-like permease family protein [Solirubrobacterales bacterium]
MLRLALRGLAAHKLRASLTALAILLGVAMVAGTLMLSDSVNRSFDDIFAESNAGIDVSVRARVEVEAGFELPEAGTAVPERLLPVVAETDGVEQASGAIGDGSSIAILDEEGERIGPPQGGPPHIVNSVQPEPFTPFSYPEGGPPTTAGEVAIDSITAEEEEYEVGQTIPITGVEGLSEYTLSGIARFGSGVPLGGATLAEFTLPEAQRITGKEGEFDEIAVEAVEGVSPEELRDRLREVLPGSVEVKTGEQIASDDAEEIKEGFGFLTTALLVFAGITVFVGGFLIFNTFSITVAQRTREFGMLRTLGASSRQVLASVVGEAFVLGLIASIIGIVAGAGFVKLLLAAFESLGFELPQSGLPIEPRTIVIALLVGLISTMASALIPARRATRVSPMEAVLEDGSGAEEDAHGRRRTVIAAIVLALGIFLLLFGLFGGGGTTTTLSNMGLGLILLFIGIAMLGGRLVKPLAGFVGGPIERLRGVTGKLARENTVRNPGRTATTSAALMIGVALVVFVLMLGAALTKSVGDAIDKTFAGDVAIFNVDGFSPISDRVAPAVREEPGVEAAAPFSGAAGRAAGIDDDLLLIGWEPGPLADVTELDWVEGSDETLAGLGIDGAIVEAGWAEDNGVEVGDALELTTPAGAEVEVTVEGSVRDRIALLIDSVAITNELARRSFDVRQDFFILTSFAPDASFDETRDEIEALLASDFPNAEARSQQQLKDEQEEQVNGLIQLIYVLLTLSVILSLVGVVNTLVLTVLERKREIGMLRAIGASRSQMRRMIRYESLITAMIGALIGAVVGVAVAVAAIKALEGDGLVLSFPVAGILVVLVLAAIAGVLAGVWPARRASRIEVMEALQYE